MVKYTIKPEKVFLALSNETRRAMVEKLAQNGTLSVTELSKPFSMSLPATLKHVRVLQNSGLVVCEKNGRVQACRLENGGFENALEWLLAHQQFWNASLDRLSKRL